MGCFSPLMKTCRGEVGPAPAQTGGERTAKGFEQELEAARCLREAGFDVADPVINQGRSFDLEVPEEVLKECFASFQSVK